MTTCLSRIGAILISLCFYHTAIADEALRHDPFARPLFTSLSTTKSEATDVAVEEAIWNPTLKAVMVAGKNSLVNVDGVIIKLGEEIDGHRLIQVKDYEAIFKKGNKRVVLTIAIQTMRQNKERGVE